MSDNLKKTVYEGADAVYELAKAAVDVALAEYSVETKIKFPDTAYYFPVIYAVSGIKVTSLNDLLLSLDVAESLIADSDFLTAGVAVSLCAEILEGIKYLSDNQPYDGENGFGFIPDKTIRALGVPLVTGDIPGVAILVGKACGDNVLFRIVSEYQAKGILTFLVGEVSEQITDSGIHIGEKYKVIPLGTDITAVVHAVSVAVRAALIFGSVKPGDVKELTAYTKERVPAFINTFGSLDSVTVSVGAGAIKLGFPVITDTQLGDMEVPGALISETDHGKIVEKSLSVRNIKAKKAKIDLPVPFASAFEGEVIRRDAMHVEFYSGKSSVCELVKTAASVKDGEIKVIGPDIDCGKQEMSLVIFAEVSGVKMQADFEPVIERKIHHWLNFAEGIMHTGQRNLVRIRVSRDAFSKGVRIRHIGEIIYNMVMEEFGSVVDKCSITLITDDITARKFINEEALPCYKIRDERISTMTDESVDTFYTCVLCQSFAPAHCCVITPERLGLCGVVSWLDAKASKELAPAGPCQPIKRLGCTDEKLGAFSEVNKAVSEATHGAVSKVTLYSMLQDPMTSCGCFECICGILPEANGVVIVNREYSGITPTGLTFGELASLTGGGVQTPGFMGHGRSFIYSKKFISADGGIKRIVWMPKELKDDIAFRLDKTAKQLYNINRFSEMICDETQATEPDAVVEYLKKKGHPALRMEGMM